MRMMASSMAPSAWCRSLAIFGAADNLSVSISFGSLKKEYCGFPPAHSVRTSGQDTTQSGKNGIANGKSQDPRQGHEARPDEPVQIGRANVCTPVTKPNLVYRLVLAKKTNRIKQ